MEVSEKRSNLQDPSSLTKQTKRQDADKTPLEIRKASVAFEDCQQAESMPLCAEKCLINLIYFLTQKSKMNDYSAGWVEKIQQNFTDLEERSLKEELTSVNGTLLKHLRSLVEGNDFRTVTKELESILKEMRPLNYFQLVKYTAEAKKAKESMSGGEVIFLLGGTGTGKSTAIHFFAGSKMEPKEVNGMKHIHPITTDENLKRIGTSPSSLSETRYIHPIKIFLDKYQLSNYANDIILCDTPGFEDTNGTEIDISNSVSICEAVQNCKSARIIILISYKSMGDRLTGIKNLAYHLVGMIKDLRKNIKAVSYIFTKFPEDEAKNIHNQLSDIHQTLDTQEQGSAVLEIIADMMEKTEDEVITLNPLKDDPKDVLRKLLKNKKKIERPDNVFTIALSPTSQTVLKNQISTFRKTISDACKRQEYPLAIYVLDQMKTLKDLKQKVVDDSYETSLKVIYNSLENDFSSAVSKLKIFEPFTNEILQRFQHSMLASDDAKLLRHVDEFSPFANFKQRQSYMTHMEKEINSLMEKIKEESGIEANSILIGMNNLLKISEEFTEFASKHEEAKTKIKEKLNEIVKNFEALVIDNKFEEFAKDYSKIQDFLVIATQILKIEKNSIKEKFTHIVTIHFEKLRQEFSDLFEMDSIKKEVIESIKGYLDKLKQAKKAFYSSEIHVTEKIKSLQEDLIKKIQEFFTCLIIDVKEMLSGKENPKPFNIVKRRFEEMSDLREIRQIESRTAAEFTKIQIFIQSFVKEIKNNIENLLKNETKGNFDYQELKEHIQNLKDYEWVDASYKGAYSKILENVVTLTLDHLGVLQKELLTIDIDVENQDNILTAYEKLSKILSMKVLKEFVPGLLEKIGTPDEDFNKKILNECDSIKSNFNWEESKNCKEQNYFSWESEYQISQKFLKICNSLILAGDCNSKIRDCQMKMKVFMKNYLNVLKESAEKSVTEILDAEEIKTSHSRKARLIKNSIVEIQEIQKVDSQRKSYSKFLQDIKDKLEEAYHTIEENIQNVKNKYLTIELNLNRANCLKILDPILGVDFKFSDLAEKQGAKSKEVENKKVTEIIDRLESGKYRLVARGLETNKGNISDIFIDSIQTCLQDKIWKDIESINAALKSPNFDLTIDKIKEIFEFVDEIEEAKKYLMPYLKDIEQDINDCLKALKKKFESSITQFLSSIENSQKLNKFSEVEEKLERLESVLDCHGGFLREQFSKKCEEYKDKYNKFLCHLQTKYQNFQDLKSNEPNKIYRELEKLKDKKPEYDAALKNVHESIVYTMHDSLSKVDTTEIMDSLKYIPDEIKEEFLTKAENIRIAVLKLADEFKKEISREGDLDCVALKRIMDRCPNRIYLERLGGEIYLKMEAMKGKINHSLKGKQLAHAVSVFENIFNLKNELQGKFKNIDILYESCKNEIEAHFKKLRGSLINVFSELSGSDSLNHSHAKQLIQKLPDSLEIIGLLDQSKSSNFVQEFAPIRQDIESIHGDVARFCSEKCDIFLKHLNGDNKSMLPTIIKDVPILEEIYLLIRERASSQSNVLEEVTSRINKKLTMYQKTILEFDLLSIPKNLSEKAVQEQCSKIIEKLGLLKEISRIRKDLNYEDLVKNFEENLIKAHSKFKIIVSDSLQKPEEQALLADVNRHYNNLKAVNSILKTFNCIDLASYDQDILNEIKKRSQEGLQMPFNEVTKCIVDMKDFAEGYLFLQEEINKKIDDFLTYYRRKYGAHAITKVGALLITEYDWKGMNITRSHKGFEGLSLSIFNDKTKKYGIPYVTDNIRGHSLLSEKLRKRYDEFIGSYEKLVKENLSKENINFEKIVSSAKLLVPKQKQLNGRVDWSDSDQQKLPSLLAHIFALWTLQNSSTYFDSSEAENKESYLLKPHPAQVVSIFRLLGIGNESEKLENNLVQLGTGEGKSVTLAVTAIVLALSGFDVHCSCYSMYLSERDFQKFQSLFDCFGVTSFIHYETFYKLCEDVMNEEGNLREIVQSMILSGKFPHRSKISTRPKILLLDEVDVFFSKDFYGRSYNISVPLKDPSIFALASYIWKKEGHLTHSEVLNSQEYKNCMDKFKDWDFLIQNAILDMLADVKRIDEEKYNVHNERIRYKELDNMLSNVRHGYRTLFCYFKEYDNNKISSSVLEANAFINVKCGSFSYAEIPKKFTYILGTTGTLETLGESEKRIIMKDYKIPRFTFTPSVFGKNNLKTLEILIETQIDYYNRIRTEIDNQLPGTKVGTRRAVIVFFETLEKLMDFKESEAFKDFTLGEVQVLTEEMDSQAKESAIRKTGVSGQVTLSTRAFGRGSDFGCVDPKVRENGGIHVIQTFFAESFSEEFQIKGRTARQGELGTYRMILHRGELEAFNMTDNELDEKNDQRLYESLNKKRNALFEAGYQANTQFIQQFQDLHHETEQFFKSLLNADLKIAKKFLEMKNKGKSQASRSNTLCLIDATYSMQQSLDKTKLTVGIMFGRIKEILDKYGVDENCFMIQIAVYRNYNVKEEKLLQVSSWESSPDNLRAFLESITVDGGWNNEAIEVGLWHANQENDKLGLSQQGSEKAGLSQVILIGDAAPNTPDEVMGKRNTLQESFGNVYWANTKFSQPTTCQEELDKLRSKKIPIHAYYVHRRAQKAFEDIAKLTGGQCNLLDIESSKGADDLTALVSKGVLANVQKVHKLGDKLTKEYDRLYT